MTNNEKLRFLTNQLNVLYPSKEKIFEMAMKNVTQLPLPTRLMVSNVLMKGSFDVIGLLGSGQFGNVYLATPKGDSNCVAVKLSMIRNAIDIKVASAELEMSERRKKEKISCMLPYLDGTSSLSNVINAHPLDNVQFVMPVGLSYTQYMKYILKLKKNILSQREMLALMYHLFSNLTIMHNHDILHRDIKPDNILLIPSPNGGIKLVFSDFGTSRVISATDFVTQCGSPMFMPISIRTAPVLDELSPEVAMKFDVYSVAITCYTILDGFQPMESKQKQEMVAYRPVGLPRPDYCTDDDIWNILKSIIYHSDNLSLIPSAEEVCDKLDMLLFR